MKNISSYSPKMNTESKIAIIEKLRLRFVDIIAEIENNIDGAHWGTIAKRAIAANGWFTLESVCDSLRGIVHMLDSDSVTLWLQKYKALLWNKNNKVGLIMAGNIPLVGFHDLLCTLVSGNRAVVKLSQHDNELMRAIINELIYNCPEWGNSITIVERLENVDKIIATGSNNSSAYFEFYFARYPHIIRKNRNGIAVLDGTETAADIQNLGRDIFTFFGLGCRNVSKIYIPEGYRFDHLFQNIIGFGHIINHNKYVNNYDYHHAIFLLNDIRFLTNDFLIVREEKSIASPVAVLHYEYYTDLDNLAIELFTLRNQFQCVVTNLPLERAIPFGTSQFPAIDDYADGVDTMEFLLT